MLIQLKNLGTLMGYPIGVITWVVVKSNDQTVFRQIWTGKRTFNSFTNFPFTLLSVFIKIVLLFKIFNLLIFNLFLIKFRRRKNKFCLFFFFFWKIEIFYISWYYKIQKFHGDHIILQNRIIEKRACHNGIKNNFRQNYSDLNTN